MTALPPSPAPGARRPAPTALVTGGAVRVGRAISEALAADGYRTVIHYHASAREADELAESIRADGGEAITVQADLRDLDALERLAEEAEAAFGGIDLLVNNAASFAAEGLNDLTPEAWSESLDLNLRAPVFLTRALARGMKRRGGGAVVNIADLSGVQAWDGYLAHGLSKAGLIHFTRAAARTLGPEVRVNAVVPGTVLPPEGTSESEVERLAARAALERIGRPEDVAGAVLYLAEAGFVTGQVLAVDGGRLVRP